jgi:hypothetical protein
MRRQPQVHPNLAEYPPNDVLSDFNGLADRGMARTAFAGAQTPKIDPEIQYMTNSASGKEKHGRFFMAARCRRELRRSGESLPAAPWRTWAGALKAETAGKTPAVEEAL